MADNEGRTLFDLGKEVIYGWNETTEKFVPVTVDDDGKLVVAGAAGGGSGDASLAEQETQTTHLTAIETAVEAIRTAVEILDNVVSGSEAQVDVVTLPALAAGTNNIGDVDVASIAAGTNTIGGTIPTATAAANGASIFRSIDLDESEEEVKATAGQVYGVLFSNTATASRFLKFYNATAANVTVGTTTPVLTLALPGNASDDVSGVIAFPVGVVFDTAITVAATTGVADNDTGAPGANEVIVNVLYK